MKLSSINFTKYNITNNYIYCCHNTTQHIHCGAQLKDNRGEVNIM